MTTRRLRGATPVVAAVLLCAPAATTASSAPSAPPGITVLAEVPEPAEAQFVAGASNYVPLAAAPAQDLRPSENKAAGFYSCPGFSGIDRPNPVTNLYLDTFTWSVFPAYKVGNGAGNINWKLNPYQNASWYMWFHSLRWLGQGIVAAGQGDLTAMARVSTIASDWYRDNPYSWKADLGAWESSMHRTNVLICLRQAIISGLQATNLPAAYAWLDAALTNHGRFLTANWSGAWNHGTDESIALFGAGCTLGRTDFKQTAQTRMAAAITTAIDAQGSTNEQSTGYAAFNYNLWGRASAALQNCGVDPGTTISSRRSLLATWLALATNSLGQLPQIGDTDLQSTAQAAGTPMEYAGSLGTKGTVPPRRIGVFSAGYVFGRTGWGTVRPFTGESAYSIRFGPAYAMHGHSDHTSITYTARGRDIIVDSGSPPYADQIWRPWGKSPAAHSVLVAPATAALNPATKLTRSAVNPTAEFYEFSDSPGSGISRVRAVLVLKDPDLLVTLDRASATKAQSFQTLWHLPEDQQASATSRSAAVATVPGSNTRTVILQIPFKQALPAGATLVKRGQTNPKQGWHWPVSTSRLAAPTVLLARSGTTVDVLSMVIPIRSTGQISYSSRWSGTTFTVSLNIGGQRASFAYSPGGTLYRTGN